MQRSTSEGSKSIPVNTAFGKLKVPSRMPRLIMRIGCRSAVTDNLSTSYARACIAAGTDFRSVSAQDSQDQ